MNPKMTEYCVSRASTTIILTVQKQGSEETSVFGFDYFAEAVKFMNKFYEHEDKGDLYKFTISEESV